LRLPDIKKKNKPKPIIWDAPFPVENPMAQPQPSKPVPVEVAYHDLLAALDRAAAASLAGGIIASSGLVHTPAQAIEVQRQVLRTMFSPQR
jgi:hypothetical protein